jgi:ERCC4 domain
MRSGDTPGRGAVRLGGSERRGLEVRHTQIVAELLIAKNPDPGSTLPYLLRVPLGQGLIFRTSGTWPRTKALFCYPVHLREWPADPEIVERVAVRSCERRGAAIDLVLARGREHRSQIVYTKGRGRDMVFWQSPRTRKQARPNVSVPTARASGIPDLTIVVDAHERYAYRFAGQQVRTVVEALPCGDYGVKRDGELVAAVERKSLSDLTSSVTDGRLRFALGELAALPRAAVVVEDRYSQLFKVAHVRPAVVLDGLAELQVRYPGVPIVFCETRSLAEEWTYRYLAAAQVWADTEAAALARIAKPEFDVLLPAEGATVVLQDGSVETSAAEVRAWARSTGMPVSDRGRLRPEVWSAWQEAHTDLP